MKKILCFGEVLLDHIENELYLGGAPVNFAINCSNLGLEVDLYSAVGEDSLGELAKLLMAEQGLNLNYIATLAESKTGEVKVEIVEGEPHYQIEENVAYDEIPQAIFDHQLSSKFYDLFYFGTLAQRDIRSRQTLDKILAAGNFRHAFFDCNLRQGFYTLETLKKSLQHATIFKANESEIEIIIAKMHGMVCPMPEACELLAKEFDIATILVTAGATGAHLLHQGQYNFVASTPVALVDAVGAGDAFSSAFAVNFVKGKNPIDSVKAGHRLGGIVANQRGAIPQISPEIKKDILL